MATTITLGFDTGPLKRFSNLMRSPKLIEKKLISKKSMLQKVGNAMRNSVKENFEQGKRSVWAEVSSDILLRRKMQKMLSQRKAPRTVPPFGSLRSNARTFISDRAEELILGVRAKFTPNSKEKVRVVVRDTTQSPDLFPVEVGELELLERGTIGISGKSFAAGIRTPKNAKALLIPIKNISGSELRRKRGETKKTWFKRAGILKSERGITIIMRKQASVGRFHIPKRRFMFFNKKALDKINEILTTSLDNSMRSLYKEKKIITKQTTKGTIVIT